MGYKNVQHYRHTVHRYLDYIWLMSTNRRQARTVMYKLLSTRMNIPLEETHVSMFTRDQCKQAIKILRPMYIQLHGSDLPYKSKKKVGGSEMYSMIKTIKTGLDIADYNCFNREFKLTVYCKTDELNCNGNVEELDDLVGLVKDMCKATVGKLTIIQFIKSLAQSIPTCYKVEIKDDCDSVWIYEIEK